MTELLPIALILIAAGAASYILGRQHGHDDGYAKGWHGRDMLVPPQLIKAKREGAEAQRRAQEVTDGVVTAIIEAETKL